MLTSRKIMSFFFLNLKFNSTESPRNLSTTTFADATYHIGQFSLNLLYSLTIFNYIFFSSDFLMSIMHIIHTSYILVTYNCGRIKVLLKHGSLLYLTKAQHSFLPFSLFQLSSVSWSLTCTHNCLDCWFLVSCHLEQVGCSLLWFYLVSKHRTVFMCIIFFL